MRGRSWVIAGIGAAAAGLAWVALPSPHREAVALALGAGGAMAAIVLGAPGMPTAEARAASGGAARAGRDIVEALALAHPPVFVPAGGNLAEERVFLPSEGGAKPLPVLDAETRLYVAPPGVRFGVAVEPPGLALVLQGERAVGARLQGAGEGEVETFLRGLGARTLLMRDVEVRSKDALHEIRFTPGDAAPCREKGARPSCASGLCPACSAACVAMTRALGRALVLESAEDDAGALRLRLREMPSP